MTGTRTALVLDLDRGPLPAIRWWGAATHPDDDPAQLAAALTPAQTQASIDQRVVLDLLPGHADGFQGTPGLRGAFGDGTGFAPRWQRRYLEHDDRRLLVTAVDATAGIGLDVEVVLDEHDLVAVRAAVTNLRTRDGATDHDRPPPSPGFPPPSPGVGVPDPQRAGADPTTTYHLDALRLTLPVPDTAREVATFTGRWLRELHLQRQPWQIGRIERGSWRGRSSHEDPPTVLAGSSGFSEEAGTVWAAHLAWPGNHELRADRTADGLAYLQLAEALHPGEVLLAPGETYVTPTLLATASATGLNGVSDAFHAHLRARPSHPTRPRPVTLNTWEAVYFDHDHTRLDALIVAAAQLGIERFVLDDGWFVGRPDDHSGLGDWVVDAAKHPEGLRPLADRVRAAGMEFGLWVEPEMVNPDSDRYRADPSVALAQPGGPTQRHQLVLDLARPDVRAAVRDQLVTAIDDAQPAYLKWDHNRDHTAPDRGGRPGAHAQVAAATGLMDELRAHRPGLEIESCASGGGRVDLGILGHTDRVWTSDCNDPIERQRIQRGLSYLLPPELMGAHVGPPTSHTTVRTSSLALRLATAFFGHLGVEWDITHAGPHDRERLRAAIALHRAWRDVLHGGRVVRVDHPDDAALVHGVVTPERAVFAYIQLTTGAWARPAAVRCPGLEPDARYRVTLEWTLTSELAPQQQLPGWYADGGVELTGRALATSGVQLHVHQPEAATVLTLERVAPAEPQG